MSDPDVHSTERMEEQLLTQIRAGNEQAWKEIIRRYEGRLRAFIRGRVGNEAVADDILQETFVGFLTSLPNFAGETTIERFLYRIAGFKVVDHHRRQGVRKTRSLSGGGGDSSSPNQEPTGRGRHASSLARSGERKRREDRNISGTLRMVIKDCHTRGHYERLKCLELLFVLGKTNQEVALELGLSEQAVANHKYALTSKLKELGD